MAIAYAGKVYRTGLEFIKHNPLSKANRLAGRCCYCDQPVPAWTGRLISIGGRIRIAHLPVIGQCSAVGEHVR